jgi:hypothetical protein
MAARREGRGGLDEMEAERRMILDEGQRRRWLGAKVQQARPLRNRTMEQSGWSLLRLDRQNRNIPRKRIHTQDLILTFDFFDKQ